MHSQLLSHDATHQSIALPSCPRACRPQAASLEAELAAARAELAEARAELARARQEQAVERGRVKKAISDMKRRMDT
jgi:uncharacterized protein involved in exopolysaccharide biosynthesis